MVRSINVSMSAQGMGKLKRFLVDYKNKLEKADEKIVSDLVFMGSGELQRRVGGITDYDGNRPGIVESKVTGNRGEISNVGPQVAFIEFGTGVQGLNNSHPFSVKSGWEYNQKRSAVAHRTINGIDGWFYFNQTLGRTVFTSGARPYGQMLHTSLYLRSLMMTVVQKAMR